MASEINRRDFLSTACGIGAAASVSLLLSGCMAGQERRTSSFSDADPSSSPQKPLLPDSDPDLSTQFGFDKNITIDTIDEYLNRDDVAYRDMRMLVDPADYAAIGGSSDLSDVLEGFKIVPFPYLGTLPELPVSNGYTGKTVFTIEYGEGGSVVDVIPNYEESELLLHDLFPRDKSIFLTCGGGGYAAFTKALLVHCGWDEKKIYAVGAMWGYKGSRTEELVVYSKTETGADYFATWRADYAFIDFERLHPLGGRGSAD